MWPLSVAVPRTLDAGPNCAMCAGLPGPRAWCEWPLPLLPPVQLGSYSEWRKSAMTVFKAKRTYATGEVLVLGGPGLATLDDLMVSPPPHGRTPRLVTQPGSALCAQVAGSTHGATAQCQGKLGKLSARCRRSQARALAIPAARSPVRSTWWRSRT